MAPLGTWVIADHFLELRLRDAPLAPAFAAFVQEFAGQSVAWRRQTAQEFELTDEALDQIGRQLPFFDWWSLLMCCSPAKQRWQLLVWDGSRLDVSLTDTGVFLVDPWPFRGGRLDLHVPGFLARRGETPSGVGALGAEVDLAFALQPRWPV